MRTLSDSPGTVADPVSEKVFQLTTYEEICQGFQRKKLCFITTAVCAQSGKPDDCPELAAFRSFRDSYLSPNPMGPASSPSIMT